MVSIMEQTSHLNSRYASALVVVWLRKPLWYDSQNAVGLMGLKKQRVLPHSAGFSVRDPHSAASEPFGGVVGGRSLAGIRLAAL